MPITRMHRAGPTARIVLALCLAVLAGRAALAHPARYRLQTENSTVGFKTDFGGDAITGTMPVARADLTLDFHSVARCHVSVTLNAAGARASFPFATQAMKSPSVLDTAQYPAITFRSTRVRAKGKGALIDGVLTIRGVSRPVTLRARFYRPPGSHPGDLSHLSIVLKGTISRSAFGADGWSGTVGDAVHLDILAHIARLSG